jgi:hypothetical protein
MSVGKIKGGVFTYRFVVEFYWPGVMSLARGSWLGGRIVDNWWEIIRSDTVRLFYLSHLQPWPFLGQLDCLMRQYVAPSVNPPRSSGQLEPF